MQEEISFQKVDVNNNKFIELIANWYLNEWSIPIEKTYQRLTNTPNDDVIFQLILLKDQELVATGGLYNKVGLLKVYPKFKKFRPWVALLYTNQKYRNQGFANILLKKIEASAKDIGLSSIYVHTFSAERLYIKNGWEPFDKVPYKGKITVVMKKLL